MLYNVIVFYISLSFYFLAACFFAKYLIKGKKEFFSYSRRWLTVSSVVGFFFLLIRYRESSYLPVVSLFEITFFYAWIVTTLYIIFAKVDSGRIVQFAPLSIVYTILIVDIFLDKNIGTLNPMLDSFWLGIHVPTAILAYGAFTLSFAISLYCIFSKRKSWPSSLDTLNFKLIAGGNILLGICIITGAIWAKSAWGRFWSWDIKETWALITFVIYGSIILIRITLKLNPRWHAFLSAIGFLAVLFTFFGVNLFFISHHSY